LRVTLEGMIPVLVEVDTESGSVTRVRALDEDFRFVHERRGEKDGRSLPRTLSVAAAGDLPVAHDEGGNRMVDDEVIVRALAIAQGAPGAGGAPEPLWPEWSWG
jgi:hypothetical protein